VSEQAQAGDLDGAWGFSRKNNARPCTAQTALWEPAWAHTKSRRSQQATSSSNAGGISRGKVVSHRIIEWLGLEGTLKTISFQPLCHEQGHLPLDQVAQSSIQPGLEHCRKGAPTASLGNQCQCLTTLMVKNFFLMPSLNLPSFSLKPSALVLSLQALVKKSLSSFLVGPFRYCKAAIRYPWSLLFSRLNSPNSLFIICSVLLREFLPLSSR